MKYEAISLKSNEFPVKKMCEVLGLQAGNYYRWKKNEKIREEKIREEIRLVTFTPGFPAK